MATTARDWFKSSYCNQEESACVEIRSSHDAVAVRDSTDPAGPSLSFEPASWLGFLSAIKEGRL